MTATPAVTSAHDVVGIVLAAGEGERLHPLTRFAPKALCPVGNVALVDHAITRLTTAVDDIAVNVHHGREQMTAHLRERVHLSVEEPVALGTAGAIGALRGWLAGRGALVTNADAWLQAPDRVDLTMMLDGWDGARVRVLCVPDVERGDFGPYRFAGVSVLPAALAMELEAEPSGLYERVWRHEYAADRLEIVRWDGTFIDCGTVADYLAANMAWSGGASVIAPDAHVLGTVQRSVLWPGALVRASEVLSEAIRGPGWTVLSR